jgi:hypothetical protein
MWREGSAGVKREFGEKAENMREKIKNKKSLKSIIDIVFKNNTIIKMLATELLNTILLLVFYDKISP